MMGGGVCAKHLNIWFSFRWVGWGEACVCLDMCGEGADEGVGPMVLTMCCLPSHLRMCTTSRNARYKGLQHKDTALAVNKVYLHYLLESNRDGVA
jgi:hypothetical protein